MGHTWALLGSCWAIWGYVRLMLGSCWAKSWAIWGDVEVRLGHARAMLGSCWAICWAIWGSKVIGRWCVAIKGLCDESVKEVLMGLQLPIHLILAIASIAYHHLPLPIAWQPSSQPDDRRCPGNLILVPAEIADILPSDLQLWHVSSMYIHATCWSPLPTLTHIYPSQTL